MDISEIKVGQTVQWLEEFGNPESGPTGELTMCSGEVTEILDEGTVRVDRHDNEGEKNIRLVWLQNFFVNVYKVSREYGGPEEGGWYYDAGTPFNKVGNSFTFATKEAAEEFKADLVKQFEPMQPRRNRNSVIGGPDIEVYIEDHKAEAFPAEKPHYE